MHETELRQHWILRIIQGQENIPPRFSFEYEEEEEEEKEEEWHREAKVQDAEYVDLTSDTNDG